MFPENSSHQSDYELATPEVVANGIALALDTLRTERDVTKAERDAAQAFGESEHYAANHDELTGLLNPRGLKEIIELYDTNGITPFIVFCDGDKFGEINKRFGQHAGDKAIVRLANVLKSSVRTQDSIVRLGGDEFIIFGAAHNMSENDLDNLRDRIEYTINTYDAEEDAELASLGMSTGAVCGTAGMKFGEVLMLADAEMRLNKAANRADVS